MLILGGVAATDMSAFKAETQMDPAITSFQTVFAAISAWSDIVNMIKVRALFCHVFFPLSVIYSIHVGIARSVPHEKYYSVFV